MRPLMTPPSRLCTPLTCAFHQRVVTDNLPDQQMVVVVSCLTEAIPSDLK